MNKVQKAQVALGVVPTGAKLIIQSPSSEHQSYYVYIKGVWYPWVQFEVRRNDPVPTAKNMSTRWLNPYHRKGLVSHSY